jgi:hypothetical protein
MTTTRQFPTEATKNFAQPERPTVVSCDEFTSVLPEASWLIDELFESDSLVTLFGPSGHGKSFIAISWGMAIATGTQWLGRNVKKGVVVYAAGEGARGAQRRAAGWKKYHDIPSVPNMHFYPGAPQLRDEKDFAHFSAQIKPIKPDLVIIDTLAVSIAGDENSSEVMGEFLKRMKDIQRALKGATVMVVHHTPLSATGKGSGKKKQQLRERGHTSLRAGVDTSISCEACGESAAPLSMMALGCQKQKDDVMFRDFFVSTEVVKLMDATETKSGKPMTTLVVVKNEDIEVMMKLKLSDNAQHLLAVFEEFDKPEVSWAEWVAAFNANKRSPLAPGTLAGYRKELTDAGVAVKVKGKKGLYQRPQPLLDVDITDSFTKDAA